MNFAPLTQTCPRLAWALRHWRKHAVALQNISAGSIVAHAIARLYMVAAYILTVTALILFLFVDRPETGIQWFSGTKAPLVRMLSIITGSGMNRISKKGKMVSV